MEGVLTEIGRNTHNSEELLPTVFYIRRHFASWDWYIKRSYPEHSLSKKQDLD